MRYTNLSKVFSLDPGWLSMPGLRWSAIVADVSDTRGTVDQSIGCWRHHRQRDWRTLGILPGLAVLPRARTRLRGRGRDVLGCQLQAWLGSASRGDRVRCARHRGLTDRDRTDEPIWARHR